MGNDARPSRKGKDDENTFGLRRSSREVSETKEAPSVRKSERLERRVPMISPEKKLTPTVSPLRRSDRGKSSASPSSVSKNAGISSSLKNLKKKSKKEKSVRELTEDLEAKEAEKGKEDEEIDIEEPDLECHRVKKKRKRLDAHAYMGAFKSPKAKKVKANKTMEDNNGGEEPSGSSMKPGEAEIGDGSGAFSIGEFNDIDATVEEDIDEPDPIELMESDHEIMSSPSKNNMLDENSNPAEKLDTYSTSPRVNLDSTGGRFSSDNVNRVNLDSTGGKFSSDSVNSNQEIAAAILTTDRGECEASTTTAENCENHMQQKESSGDLQTVGEQNTCFKCKVGGSLLCCHGKECKRSYHPTCLDPPMDGVILGVWYCLMCVMKKLDYGEHSVSEGVEAIFDDRVVEVLDVDASQEQRVFFVKYKGLAHFHNIWVPECKLLLDAPSLVEKFNRESQVWKPEWKVPHRLLLKRLLISPEGHHQNTFTKLDGHHEWLVKWCSLGYEQATWELDYTLLSNADGKALIKDYENRHSMLNGDSSSLEDKILESEKLLELLAGRSTQFRSSCQDYYNKLHEFWLKGQNAVVIDEQERILKVASLVQSFRPKPSRPFLIISTLAALHLWDDGVLWFVNAVVYSGDKDLRRSIRKLEFGEGGSLMFQVLITTMDIVLEELDVFRSIEWELIIIDECQCPTISSHFVEIKQLDTGRRLLLVSGQLKETIAEYRNLLSFIESPSDSQSKESLLISPSDNLGKLKEKFSKYVVYQSKLGSSRFNEYWVPAPITNVQLEVYCNTLISNSTILCSSPKNFIVDSVHDILMSCRKCFNHPYLGDRRVVEVVTKGFKKDTPPYYRAGVKACGKLQLLHMMLLEIQKRGLRVLILFPGADLGTASLGHILEDFLIHTFGKAFYERVDSDLKPSQKISAMNNFNKDCERFVFLLENRACNSSIKLCSVDIVIIFSSDLNPVNDVRALQKITLDLKREQVTTFRLYTPYTVEEKVLHLSKEGKPLDGKSPNINLSMSHMLLMWGAAHQFNTLDKFHGEGVTTSSTESLVKEPSLEDVMKNFSQIISSDRTDNESIIINVQQVGGIYCTESSLYGELQSEVMDKVQPHLFWTGVLEGKHPQWKFISYDLSQRTRKKVHYSDETSNNTGNESEEICKKRKKLSNSTVDPPSIELGSDGKSISSCKEGAFGTTTDNQQRKKTLDAQKSLHRSLKPEILKLCKLLKLSDQALGVAEEFLEYVMKYHCVNRESNTILQAFQISLCWTVTSLLKQKIDHKESLELARQHLNFECKKDEAECLYSMLRCLKNIFAYQIGKLKIADSPKAPMLTTTDTLDHSKVNGQLSVPSNVDRVKVGVQDCTGNMENFDKLLYELAEKDINKSIKNVKSMFQKNLEKLIQKLEIEKNETEQNFEEGKTRIQKNHKLKRAAALTCFEHNTSMREEQLKSVDNSLAKELEELRSKRDLCLKNLETKYLFNKIRLQEAESCWVKDLESWASDELLNKPPIKKAVTGSKCSLSDQVRVEDNPDNLPLLANLLNNRSQENLLHETAATDEVTCIHIDSLAASDSLPGSGSLEQNTTGPVSDAQVIVSADPSANMQNFVSTESSSREAHIANESTPIVPETASSIHGDKIVYTEVQISTKEQIAQGVTLDVDHSGEKGTELCNVTSNGVAVINQEDRVDNACNQNSLSQEPPPENSCAQPAVTLADGIAASRNEVPLGECDLPPISCGTQLVDAQTADKQNTLEEVVRSGSEPIPPLSSTQSVPALQPVAQLVEENERRPGDEGLNSIQVSQAPVQPVENPQFSNQAVSYPMTSSSNTPVRNSGMHVPDLRNMSVSESYNHLAPPMPLPMMSWGGPPLNPDPLQVELERLCQEFDQTRKTYDDKKQHLKGDYEKEIAEINKKYETMNREVDTEFFVKNKNFDDLRNKLWLNKILAEAFRSKCEYRSIDRSGGPHQDVNAAVMQHLVQLQNSFPMQQNLQRPPFVPICSGAPIATAQNVQRPPFVATSSTAPYATMVQNVQRPASPAFILQNAQRPASPAFAPQNAQRPASPAFAPQNAQRPASPAFAPQNAQRPASPATAGQNAQRPASPATTVPNAQRSASPATVVPVSEPSGTTTVRASVPVPTVPARPPQINSVSYPAPNLQGSPQIRSTPPHLLRPSGPSLTSHPRGIQQQTRPTNIPASALNTVPNLQPQMPSSMNQSVRAASSQPVSLPTVPVSLPEVRQNTQQFNSTGTGRPTDVVCLSDDD
ncbi:hypothetical protein CsatA_008576 [Cannabis sativa]